MRRAINALSAVAAALLLLPVAAHAQEQTGRPASLDHIVVGLGAVYTPTYQGADRYRTLPIPVTDVVRGHFFANLQNGVGFDVIQGDAVTVGASVTYTPGYRRKDVPDGIGELSFGAGARMFASVRAGAAVLTLGGTKGFAWGTKGIVADVSLSYPLAISSRITLIPGIETSWADRKYNDRYFGVDAVQAQASGLPQFHAGQGFKDVSATITANARLTKRISLSLSGGSTRLLGRVQDSPIVVHRIRPTGILSISYLLGS